ncbi:MAG: hypothetical protein HY714_02560 [Candidatus Omnitrophica bacterium]|nr:hypothetical protein [Candidatus Omnitrophota bacterium]
MNPEAGGTVKKIFGYLLRVSAVFIFSASVLFAEEDEVKIKILAVNPSDSQQITSTVSQILPAEVKPEDILDNAGMEVKYDVEKKTYYVIKQVELAPQEARTLQVTVRNVWKVPEEELARIREQVEQSIAALKGTKFFESGQLLYEKAVEKLDLIQEEEAKSVGIKQRIELYRAHVRQLEEIQTSTFSLAAMRRLDNEKEEGIRMVKMMVTAENPAEEEREMTMRAQLPKEITADDILDKLDFSLTYDNFKKRYVAEKKDKFAARESKKYEILLKDIWYFPQSQLDFLKLQTEKLLELFAGSSFEAYSKHHGDFIFNSLAEIMVTQAETLDASLEEKIRSYVLNSSRLELIKQKMRELQDLLPEVPLKRKEEEVLSQLKNFVKKLIEQKDLVLVAMGIQPDRPMTWWIIIGIIVFLCALTVIFYMTWLKKLQENKWVKAAPTARKPKGSTT